MHQVNSKYAGWFNAKYDRVGHLYQGRYQAIPIRSRGQLLAVCIYIHLNPVRATIENGSDPDRIMAFLAGYVWSSYPVYAGYIMDNDFGVDFTMIFREMAKGNRGWGQQDYREYIERYLMGLSRTAFGEVEKVAISPHGVEDDSQEDPESINPWKERARVSCGVPIARFAEVAAKKAGFSLDNLRFRIIRGLDSRDLVIFLCKSIYPTTMKTVGEVFNIKASAVGMAVKRVRDKIATDRGYRKKVDGIKKDIRNDSEIWDF